jgi:hypothetical protein
MKRRLRPPMRSGPWPFAVLGVLAGGTFALGVHGHSAFAAVERSPEQEALLLSERLKPIPDEEWKNIAGARLSEKYDIVKGDTLYDISKRLFGDPKYWPKVWALNNGAITNPHLIRPGNQVAFLPGTGTALPSVAIQTMSDASPGAPASASIAGAEPAAATPPGESPYPIEQGAEPAPVVPRVAGRSQEWRTLPRQKWEFVAPAPSQNVDAQGFDKNSRIFIKPYKGFELQNWASSEKIMPLAEIVGSRTEGVYLMLGDTVFMRTEQELQVGETYTITSEPTETWSRLNKREGYIYHNLGTVKVIGVKDGRFVGTITASTGFIPRGSMIVQGPPRVKSVEPVAGPSPLEAEILFDRSVNTYASAQYKQVYVDRGTDDGVREGMVFRVYKYDDPVTEDRITDSDFIVDADLLVVQVSERISSAIVLQSVTAISEGQTAVLLTDVGDVKKQRKVREKNLDLDRTTQVDQVDELDVSGGLGKREAKELRQLERWKENGKPLQGMEGQDPGAGLDDELSLEPQPEPTQPPAEAGEDEFPSALPPPAGEEQGPLPATEPPAAEMPPTGGDAPAQDELNVPPPEDLTPPEQTPPTAESPSVEEPPPVTQQPPASESAPSSGGEGAVQDQQDLDNLLNQ